MSSIKKPSTLLPFVVIATADGTKPISGYSADNATKDFIKDLARSVKKQIREDPSIIFGETPAVETADSTSDETESGLLVESRKWTNIQGKTIAAAVVSVDDINVVFQLSNGKSTTYPLINLSEHSRALLKELTE